MDNNLLTLKTYNKIAKNFSFTHHDPIFWKKEFNYFKSRLLGKKVIDIGCGAGRDAVLFIRHHFDYLGIDGSKGMLSVAKKRVPKGKFKVMDYFKMKFPGKTFDGFWATAALLHLPKKKVKIILRVIYKLSKDDAIGFISMKKKKHLDEGVIEETKFGGIKRYFAFYTKKEFSQVLIDSGFKIIKSYEKPEGDDFGTIWLCYFVKKA